MIQILNSADKAYRYAVAIGDEIFSALHKAVVDTIAFPISSHYTNVAARIHYVRVAVEKEVADWVAVGGSGQAVAIGENDVTNPNNSKWGAESLTGLKEAGLKIPVPSSTWTKVNIRQVNDALAVAWPHGITDEVEGNVRQKDYAYADCTGDIANSKLAYDVLVMSGHPVFVEAKFYNGTTLVSTEAIAATIEY